MCMGLGKYTLLIDLVINTILNYKYNIITIKLTLGLKSL